MNKSRSISPFSIGIIDFFLLNISFFVMYYWKRGTFDLTSIYVKLLMALYLFWFLVSLFTKKFQFSFYKSYSGATFLFLRSAVYTAYCASLMLVLMGLPAFSRIHFFGTFILLLFMELAIFSIYYLSIGQRTEVGGQKTEDGGQRSEVGGRRSDVGEGLRDRR